MKLFLKIAAFIAFLYAVEAAVPAVVDNSATAEMLKAEKAAHFGE